MANEAFCDISKYSREELVGHPHNIIRHPDMPGKFFELFWATIKKGETFRGIVKNRPKDDAHYWVNAPIISVTDERCKMCPLLIGSVLTDSITN